MERKGLRDEGLNYITLSNCVMASRNMVQRPNMPKKQAIKTAMFNQLDVIQSGLADEAYDAVVGTMPEFESNWDQYM